MAFERVKKIKCIKNINSKGEKVNLTIGEIYHQQFANAGEEANNFGVFDDNGHFISFDRSFFEIVETVKKENTGWTIECNDCKNKVSIDDFKLGFCPKCGQKI